MESLAPLHSLHCAGVTREAEKSQANCIQRGTREAPVAFEGDLSPNEVHRHECVAKMFQGNSATIRLTFDAEKLELNFFKIHTLRPRHAEESSESAVEREVRKYVDTRDEV